MEFYNIKAAQPQELCGVDTGSLIDQIAIFFYKVSLESDRYANDKYPTSIAAEATDTYSYFDPMENFRNTGRYWDAKYEDYRMPGYGWVYLVLRSFLSITATTNTIIFIQLFLSAISVYALGEIAFMVFRKDSYFFLTFFIYAISTFVSIYDHSLLTESFCASSFIFSIYFLIKADRKPAYLLLAGLFLTWSMFLRPVMSLLFIFYILYVLIKNYNANGTTGNLNRVIIL